MQTFVLLVNHDSIALSPLPWDKIFKIYSHTCNTWVHLPEIAVTALGRIISGYTAM